MKECSSCHKTVDDLAHTCPHCGSQGFVMSGSNEDVKKFAETMLQQEEAAKHVNKANEYYQQGQLSNAESELKKALELNPQNSMATGNMGYLLLKLERPKEAIGWFEKALQLNPNHPTARDALKQARQQAGEESHGDKSGCFIATATMGDYDHPVVLELRRFRDEFLKNQKWGRSFIRSYYNYSPFVANIIKKSVLLKKMSYIFMVKPLTALSKKLMQSRDR